MKKLLRKFVPAFILEPVDTYLYLKHSGAFTKHPFRDAFKLARWQFSRWFGSEILFTTPDGTRFISMPRNFSSLIVYFKNFRDPAIQKFMEVRLHDGSVFVDAGANVGTYTVRASQLVGTGGKVIAVEAHPFTFQYLQRNIALNDLNNVTPVHVALGSENGSINISYDASNPGETHIAGHKEQSVAVPLKKLDEVLSGAGISRVDYLKIDVEGFEYPLLLGSRRTIADNLNIVVQIELIEKHAARYGHSVKQIVEFLEGFGLSPHTVDDSGKPQPTDLFNLGENDVLWYREH